MQENQRMLPGGGIIVDRRTEDQRAATIGFVVATDRFMSGWGQAPGRSYFAVPVRSADQLDIVLDNMRERSEMKRVRLVPANYRPHLRDGDHLSIVALDDDAKTGFYARGWFAGQNCARRNRELREKAGICPDCNGAGAVPSIGPEENQDNGAVPCPTCKEGAA